MFNGPTGPSFDKPAPPGPSGTCHAPLWGASQSHGLWPWSLTAGENGANCFAFDPAGKFLVTAGWIGRGDDIEAWKNGDAPGVIRIWDVSNGMEIAHFGGDFGAVFDVAFSPDGKKVVTAGRVLTAADRGAVRIWNVETHDQLRTLLGHTKWVLGIAVSPDGKLIASGSFDRTVRVWDIATGNKVAVLNHPSTPERLSFTSDGSTFVAGCRGGEVKLWDAKNWTEQRAFLTKGIYLRGTALTRDKKRIVIGGFPVDADGRVRSDTPGLLRVLDGESGLEQVAWRVKGHPSDVAISPNGNFLADAANPASIWNIKTQEEVARLERGMSTSGDMIRFAPDGRTIAISDSSSVTLWDISELWAGK